MKPRVLVTKKLSETHKTYLETHCDCEFLDHRPLSRSELLDKVGDVEGLLQVGTRIDEDLLSKAPHLKIVSNVSVGYNNFDVEAMRTYGVLGTHTPGVLDDTVADLVFGLIINVARRLSELDRYVKEGRWQPSDLEELFGVDVHHKKLGIIGMGRIGQKIAKRAALGFDMEVSYYNRSNNLEAEKAYGAIYKPITSILKESDFIVLMVPLTDETKNMIDQEAFKQMKPNAIFINASRGATVDESALFEAVNTGLIKGAGLDVFREEPVPVHNALLSHPRIITLPHIGSATHATRELMAKLACENLVKGVKGEVPPNVVTELKSLITSL